MRRHSSHTEAQQGFTLIEMIISLAVMGIIAMVMIPLLQMPMNGYLDAQRRVELQAQVDLIRRKLNDDLANAVPGSLRVRQVGGVNYLEFLQIKAVGRYRSLQTTPVTTDYCTVAADATCSRDAFKPSCAEACFTSLGTLTPATATPAVGDYFTVMPSSGTVTPNTAYTTTGTSPTARITATGAVPGGFGLRFASHTFGSDHPQKRFYLIQQPVSYVCTPIAGTTTGTLVRRWGYALAAAQPTAFPAGTNTATLSTRVFNTCVFNLSTAVTAPQNLRQTVSLQIQLATISGAAAVEQTQAEMQFAVKEP